MTVPAVIVNAQQDLIASNLIGRALFSPHFEANKPNLARFISSTRALQSSTSTGRRLAA